VITVTLTINGVSKCVVVPDHDGALVNALPEVADLASYIAEGDYQPWDSLDLEHRRRYVVIAARVLEHIARARDNPTESVGYAGALIRLRIIPGSWEPSKGQQ
jgi:hypothetical protein